MPGNCNGAKILQIAERFVQRPLVEERRQVDLAGKPVDECDPEAMPFQRGGLTKFFL